MAEFLAAGWGLLTSIYAATYQAGYGGCLVAALLGFFLGKTGLGITGREEKYRGTPSGGNEIDVRKIPAIQGTAKNFIEHWFGVLLRITGAVLVGIAFLAAYNIMAR